MAVLCAFAVLVAVPSGSTAARGGSCADAHLKVTRDSLDRVARATACLVNVERARAGMKPVRFNGRLTRAARGHSQEMVEEGFFDHIAPDGSTPITRAERVKYIKPNHAWYIAENLGVVRSRKGTAAEQVDSWMGSPGHAKNILATEIKDVGIGVAIGCPEGGKGITYTLDLGRSG